ncbi:hypothetical protein [Clostridium saccharoperbutylacetonicum]
MNRKVDAMEMAMRRVLGQIPKACNEKELTDEEIENRICTLKKELGITALEEENQRLREELEAVTDNDNK